MKTLFLSLTIIGGLMACSKQADSPTPTPTPTPIPTPTGVICRISTAILNGVLGTYEYDKDGYITNFNSPSVTTSFIYDNDLLVGISQKNNREKYSYENGALKTITVVETDQQRYIGYKINIETDATKRIIKMSDSFGYVNEFKRDNQGNVTEIKNFRGTQQQSRLVISDYDYSKSRLSLYKGWQFNVQMYYGDYMTPERLVNNMFGCANNATKIQKYYGGPSSLTSEWTHTIEYNADGYSTLITDDS